MNMPLMFELIANTFHVSSVTCHSDLELLKFKDIDYAKERKTGKAILQQCFGKKNNVRTNCLQVLPVHT